MRIWILVSFLCASFTCVNAEVPESKRPDRLWFTLATQSPIAKGSDYYHLFGVAIPEHLAGTEIPPLELQLEFRRVTDHQTVAFIPFHPLEGITTYPYGFSTSKMGIHDELKTRLAELPPGEYQVTVVRGKERARYSSVSTFRIDPDFALADLPVLSAVLIEAPPYGDLPKVLVRIAGSHSLFEPFRVGDAKYPTLVVDGVELSSRIRVGFGMDPEVRHGLRFVAVVPTHCYPFRDLDPAGPHTLQVKVKTYMSEAIPLELTRPLGDIWDRETKPLPSDR